MRNRQRLSPLRPSYDAIFLFVGNSVGVEMEAGKVFAHKEHGRLIGGPDINVRRRPGVNGSKITGRNGRSCTFSVKKYSLRAYRDPSYLNRRLPRSLAPYRGFTLQDQLKPRMDRKFRHLLKTHAIGKLRRVLRVHSTRFKLEKAYRSQRSWSRYGRAPRISFGRGGRPGLSSAILAIGAEKQENPNNREPCSARGWHTGHDVILSLHAEVAELADAPALGAGGRKAGGGRVPFSAPYVRYR